MAAWDRYNDLVDLALTPEPLTARFHAEVAYGFRQGEGLFTPYTQLNMTDSSTVYGAGLRYAVDTSLDLDLRASHLNRSSGNNENRVFLQLHSDQRSEWSPAPAGLCLPVGVLPFPLAPSSLLVHPQSPTPMTRFSRLSLPQVLAAPVVAGSLFLLPASLAQTNQNSGEGRSQEPVEAVDPEELLQEELNQTKADLTAQTQEYKDKTMKEITEISEDFRDNVNAIQTEMDKLLDQTENQANTMQTKMDGLLNQTRNQATTIQTEMDKLLDQAKNRANTMQTKMDGLLNQTRNQVTTIQTEMDKLLDQTKNRANTMQTKMDSLLNQTRNQSHHNTDQDGQTLGSDQKSSQYNAD